MKRRLASALMWLAPCILFIFRDEILSLMALCIMGVMCIGGLIAAREAM
ncbi:MAG: hypothetical protein J6S14_02370 [Clostridia bacterium]|nr:hypothetical protein [Clostridia bacterium]